MKRLPLTDARIKLLLLSLMHLATDALCAFLVFSKLYPENPKLSFAVFVSYNLLAFVAQSPLGILLDKYGDPPLLFGVSTAAMACGYLCHRWCLVAVLFIGLGNALFHVAGGKYVTDKSGNNVAHLGIFVSTGAIGLALGQRFSAFGGFTYLFFGILVGCALIMIFSKDPQTKAYTEEYRGKGNGVLLAFLAVIAVVFVRSFVGKVVTADFELTQLLFLLIAIATALGKAVGGILARLLGAVPTAIASMCVAAVCLTLGCAHPYIYILGVFAFNFSMPITLCYANVLWKGQEGFAFGTLAAILVPGYLLAMLFEELAWGKPLAGVLCFLSAILIVTVSKRIPNADRTAFDARD